MVQYERVGSELHRSVLDPDGYPTQDAVLWRGVTDWSWRAVPGWSARLVEVDVTYRRFAPPRTPLPTLPLYRRPRSESVTDTLLVAPRADGLGQRW
jgi:hypothetical protein